MLFHDEAGRLHRVMLWQCNREPVSNGERTTILCHAGNGREISGRDPAVYARARELAVTWRCGVAVERYLAKVSPAGTV